MPKLTVWKQYIQLQDQYSKKYGDKCICLIQVGSFYEIYSLHEEGYMKDVCDIMGITISNKNVGEEVNPYMAGVPDYGVKKFLDRLIEENYTVVIIDQIGPKNSKGGYDIREVTKILTKSNVDIFFEINSNSNNDNNNLLSIYIQEEKTLNGKSVISAGLSVINLSTGINHIYEINSQEYDIFDEVYRFMESFNPIEIIIHTKDLKTYTQNDILNRLNVLDKIYYYNFYNSNSTFFKLSYQQDFLKKIFPNTGMLNVINYIDLQFKLYALNSYILLLQWAYEHENNIVTKITCPQIFDSHKHLILYNNALYQLDVIPSNIRKYSGKFKSLYDVINETSTPMGRRELKNRLLNPITDVAELNLRYNLVTVMMNHIDNYETYLKKIVDIERYHRKMTLGILQPKEYANISLSYDSILKIIEIYQQDFVSQNMVMNINDNDIQLFREYVEEYHKLFDVDKMIKYDIKNIDNSFFTKGLYDDIDKVQEQLDECRQYFANWETIFSQDIKDYEKQSKKKYGIQSSKKIVNLIYQEKKGNKHGTRREGEYFYILNKRRADILKQILKTKKMDGYKFETYTSTDIKLTSDEINNQSNKLTDLINDIDELVRDKYLEILKYFDNKYNFNNISQFIGEIDVVKSCSKISKLYGYCRPIIECNEDDNSFINAVDVRHPIVERLSISTNYIPNDVKLDQEVNGMLLYSLNSCGKTTYAKSVGLNIILAQMGCYTAAKEFKYYPYHHIFTRISGDDNLFYGQSSFAIEMDELRAILKYADKNSLVLGDEVCRGTETTSALALVTSSINKFSKNDINFIFATHLHQLNQIETVTELKNVKFYHLAVNTSNGNIVYERKLKDGSGESIYGLEVAKHLVDDNEFIDFAYKIRNELLNVPEYIVQPKSSKYNADIYINNCQICDKSYKDEQLDVHHILFQSQCNQNGLIDHIKKNDKNNLVVLCKEHHIQVHNKNLEIYGYKDTENGIILDYKFLDTKSYEDKKKNRLKYNPLEIKIIEGYKGNPINYIINKLKVEYDINISRTTLNKIYNDEYGI